MSKKQPVSPNNQRKPKGPREAFYVVMGQRQDGGTDLLNTLTTVGQARKWVSGSMTLISRTYQGVQILRCRSVPLENPNPPAARKPRKRNGKNATQQTSETAVA